MIPVNVCASASMIVCPVHYTHKTDSARPHQGFPRACGAGLRPGAEGGCGGAAPQAGSHGRAGPRPGLPALPGLSSAANPRSGENRHVLRKT